MPRCIAFLRAVKVGGRTPPRAPAANASPALPGLQHEAALNNEPAAGVPDAIGPLLDTAASRRAIRASARAPSLSDQLARAREAPEPVGAQQRLANGVKGAGKGDCLKGEYAGAGMGLLSLPFFVIAEARSDCAK